MKFLILLLVAAGILFSALHAQTPALHTSRYAFTHKGQAFVQWGYNWSAFTRSDIHLQGPGFGFTLYDVTAADRPSKFSTHFKPDCITCAQYNGRVGVFLSERWAVSLGLDHLQYIVNLGQTVNMTGSIAPQASDVHTGYYDRTPKTLTYDFLRFDHSNGLNYLHLGLDYHLPLWSLPNGNLGVQLVGGATAGVQVVRTEVVLFGELVNSQYRVAGAACAAHGAARVYFLKHWYVEGALKGGFVTMPNVILDNTLNSFAQHEFGFVEGIVMFGGQFQLF